MTEEKQSEYVTVEEAMKILGVTRMSLDNYVKRGLLTKYHQRAPRRTMYKRAAIEALKRPQL